MKQLPRIVIVLAAALLVFGTDASAGVHPAYSDDLSADTVKFYDTESYDSSVPDPGQYLRYPIGKKPNTHTDIIAYLKILAESSDRITLEPHGRTHEGRELFHLIISTPKNLARLDEHVASMDRVADPLKIESNSELEATIETLPAFAWMAYSIHGDELSGTDAASRLAYHLAAATDSVTMHLLENVIILLDPCENPDGRERYLSMLQTYDSNVPNYDSRAMQHNGVWPWGRGNHYWFDLNRDWFVLTQPETRGRVETIVKYHPVVVVDGHEMGPNATFLFSPPRQPINYNTPDNVLQWYETYAADQADAFDQRGWPYYTGEWNDQWFVGFGSAWPTLFGTVGILYEQARVDGEFIRQRDNYLLTFHEAVNHQFTSSLANLQTTADNRLALLRDFYNARKTITQQGNMTFLFAPDADTVKMNRFIAALVAQGIAVKKASAGFRANDVIDPYHQTHGSKSFPAGTYLVSTAQPHGALAKAILEFDLHLKKEFLEEERRQLEKEGDTKMYETSAWSMPLAYNLDAYYTTGAVSATTEMVTSVTPPVGRLVNPDATYGFVVDMAGENTYRLLNRLFAEKFTIFAAEKDFTIEGRSFQRGALVLRRRGNPEDLGSKLGRLAVEIGIDVYGVNTGYADKGSHLGAPTFRLLQQPRVALCAGMPLSTSGSGHLWFAIDQELEIPHSLLPIDRLSRYDLSAYNVLIIPDAWGGGLRYTLGSRGASQIEKWVSDGGTLILMGSSAEWAADTSNGLSGVRLRRQVLDKLDTYDLALRRELSAEAPVVDTMALWHPEKVPAEDAAEQEKNAGGKGNISEEDDAWMRRFHPRGVIVRADLDPEHFMTFGLDERLPVSVYTSDAWVTKDPVNTVARLTPDETKLRMGGLLWPEGRKRWAGTAYATQERKGQGQIIMFLNSPNFRAHWYGTRAMFVNAMLYGPGFTSGFEPYNEDD